MNKLLIISLIVLILLVIIYTVLVNIIERDPKDIRLVYDITTNLSEGKRIIDSDTAKEVLLNSSNSTLLAYVYLEPGDRTANITTTTQSLLKQGDSWAINIKNGGIPELTVTTLNGIETTELPVIPYQKWIALTIVREGRRFDIYYNSELVASHRLSKYIKIQLASVQAGSEGLRGKITKVYIAGRSYDKNEMHQIYATTSDTRGRPHMKEDSIIPKLGCPSGLFCFVTASPPPSPYQRWVTQYS